MALLPTLILSSSSGGAHQLFTKGDVQAADFICTASCIAGPAAVAVTKDKLGMSGTVTANRAVILLTI